MKNSIWLIGTGEMGREYAKVMNDLNYDFIAVGRSENSAITFFNETGVEAITGGLELFLSKNPTMPDAVIVAVGIESLSETAIQLLNYGVKNILLEKPGVGSPKEIDTLNELCSLKAANVLLAYNRRFYSSILKAKELINMDGGVKSFNFEFTEWSHSIKNLQKDPIEHNFWFLGNSSHVIDTAFNLCGIPTEMSSYFTGGTNWHPASSIFAGAGICPNNVLFSYIANWEGPGRWNLEIVTKDRRLILKPMEILQEQKIGSIEINPILIDNNLDISFKPGIYLQTKAFINGDYSNFCTLSEQEKMIKNFYIKMSGY